MFKAFKKGVTGNESAKDAFTDFEAFQATIEPYNFMPFDMICKTSGAIDTLLGQREEMIQYGLMKERVPDVDLGRAKTAIAELTKAFPPDSINPAVKCFARCGAGGFSQYNMQKLACFDTLEGKINKIISMNNDDIARKKAAA